MIAPGGKLGRSLMSMDGEGLSGTSRISTWPGSLVWACQWTVKGCLALLELVPGLVAWSGPASGR